VKEREICKTEIEEKKTRLELIGLAMNIRKKRKEKDKELEEEGNGENLF